MILAWTSNFATNTILSIAAFLDSIIYGMISLVTSGIFEITKIDIFSGTIGTFTQRIYVVLGIFMIFKLSFSLLQAVINPDVLLDKERGFQKIIPRTITMLCMLIILPTVFNVAREAQQDLLPVVPALVLGQRMDYDESLGQSAGENLASISFATFMQPADADACPADNLAGKQVSYIASMATEVCPGTTNFKYNYTFLISGIVGLILVVMLASITIDIAIRSIKLGVLELAAPIPIISYIDPKSQKDGAFAKWSKSCISTYLDLFVKFIIIYLLLFLFQQLTVEGGILSDSNANIWTKLMIILGIVFFMKQAPKFIKDILGIKGGGNNSLGFNGVLGAAGAVMAGGGLAGAASGFLNGMNTANEANAQGKDASGVYAANRARITEMRTGVKGAQGGMMERLDMMARGRMAGRFGLTEKNLNDAETYMHKQEDEMFNAGNRLKDAENAYKGFQGLEDPGTWVPAETEEERSSVSYQKRYDEWKEKKIAYAQDQALKSQLELAREDYHKQELRLQDAKSNYEKGKDARGAMVQKTPKYTAKKQFNAIPKSGAARDTTDNDNAGGYGAQDHGQHRSS